MPGTMHSTKPVEAADEAVRTRALAMEPVAADRSRPVENITRVTVAFPFATIRTAEPDLSRVVGQLAELVADLAAELDGLQTTAATVALVERARLLQQAVPVR